MTDYHQRFRERFGRIAELIYSPKKDPALGEDTLTEILAFIDEVVNEVKSENCGDCTEAGARGERAALIEKVEGMRKEMVDKFLSWKLPADFNPDGGISFKRMRNENTPYPAKNEPVGTNLFTATQAAEMVDYMLEGCDLLTHLRVGRPCPACEKGLPYYHECKKGKWQSPTQEDGELVKALDEYYAQEETEEEVEYPNPYEDSRPHEETGCESGICCIGSSLEICGCPCHRPRCVGNCPNVCKVHMGEYDFCDNGGCICHKPRTEALKEYPGICDATCRVEGEHYHRSPITSEEKEA